MLAQEPIVGWLLNESFRHVTPVRLSRSIITCDFLLLDRRKATTASPILPDSKDLALRWVFCNQLQGPVGQRQAVSECTSCTIPAADRLNLWNPTESGEGAYERKWEETEER